MAELRQQRQQLHPHPGRHHLHLHDRSSDAGSTLDVTVTGSNTAGSAQATPDATGVVPQPSQPPANVNAPLITGTVAVGQQLLADPGSWTGTPTPVFSYQWQSCDSSGNNCTPIQGATTSTYTIASSDAGSTLDVTVTATNTAGSSQAAPTTATTVVPQPSQPPANVNAPLITGTVAVGQQLLADPGSWTGTPTPVFSYQWLSCDSSGNNCTPIQGATNNTYTIAGSDAGSTLDVTVTGTNTAGSSQAVSAATSVVPQPSQPPANVNAPLITGTVAVGQQLQAEPGTWTGTPTPVFSYQWLSCDSSGNNCTPIQGATNNTYTIAGSDAGSTLDVTVTATNTAGSSQAAPTTATSVVPQPSQPPANVNAPLITGTVAVGQQLQASAGTWTGTPTPVFSYQWQSCNSSGNNCTPIAGRHQQHLHDRDRRRRLDAGRRRHRHQHCRQQPSRLRRHHGRAATEPAPRQRQRTADHGHSRRRPTAAGERRHLDRHTRTHLLLPVAELQQQRQQLHPDPGRHHLHLHDRRQRRRLDAGRHRHRHQHRRQQPSRANHRHHGRAATQPAPRQHVNHR